MGEYVGYLWKMGNVGNKIAVNPWIKGGKGMQRKTKYGVTDGAVNSWIKGGKGTRRKTKYGVRDCDRSVTVGQKNCDRFWPIGRNYWHFRFLTDRSESVKNLCDGFWPCGHNIYFDRLSVKIIDIRSKFVCISDSFRGGQNFQNSVEMSVKKLWPICFGQNFRSEFVSCFVVLGSLILSCWASPWQA